MRAFKAAVAAVLVALAPLLAHAQSSPGFVTGQVPTAAQWNGYFAAKVDYGAGAPFLNPCTATATGLVPTPPNDPTRFLNGQCAWTTVSGSGNVSATGSGASVGTIPTWTGTYTLNPAGLSFGTSGINTILETNSSGFLNNAVLANIPSSAMASTIVAGTCTSCNLNYDAAGRITGASSGSSGAIGFNAITSGTNTAAIMTVGTGSSLSATGTGAINATSMPTTGLSGLLLAAQFPALTGDITTAGATLATVLANVNANVGSFTNANITVDAKGRITAAANGSGGSSNPPFNTITSGINTTATMFVGSGASLAATGSGTVAATSAPWAGITGTPNTLAGYGITNGATSGANSNITSLAGLTTPLSVAQGGTGINTLASGAIPMGAGISAFVASELTDVGSNGIVAGAATGGQKGPGTINMAGCFVNNVACAAGSSTAFSAITGGTNTSAAMIVGTGSSLSATGTGSITATAMAATGLTGTLQAAQFPALTGDITTTAGSLSTVLATVNANVGTFAVETVNAKGLVTAAANLTGDVTSSGGATTLATVNANVGSFTNANVTVNAKGLITAAANGGTSVLFSSLTSGTNTVAAMLVGSGASLGPTGTGTITATAMPATGLTGTLQAGQFPALTGDVTTTAGALATTLATVNANVGSFTNANITVNAKGLITAAANGSGATNAFSSITSGTNTAAAMLVGTGASLGPTGSGTITATNVPSSLGTGTVCSTAGVLSAPTACPIVPTTISISSVVLAAVNAGQLVISTSGTATTSSLAQSTGALGSGFGVDFFTEGATSTLTIGGTSKLNNQTTLKIGAYQDISIAADGLGNYVGAASLPWPSSQTGTTFFRDDMINTNTLLGPMVLGASGTAGSLTMGNATTGLLTIQPVTGALGTVTASLPANTGTIAELNLAQTWTAVQTFNNSDILLLGSSTGFTTFTSANASASNFTLTFPAVTDQLVGRTTTDVLTNKTLTNPTIIGATTSGTWTGTPTFTGNLTFSGVPNFTGTLTGTQTQCLGLTAGNALAAVSGACGTGGGTTTLNQITSGTSNTLASITTTFTSEIWLSATSGAKTDNVPGCVAGINKDYLIENDGQNTAGTNPITVTPTSGTIGPNGTTTYAIASNGNAVMFQCDGTSTTWRLVANSVPGSAVRSATATTLTIGANDNGNEISQNNAAAVSATIAQAGTTGFPTGAYQTIIQNIGAGAITITPATTSTINGNATLVIPGGTAAAPTGALITADLVGNYTGILFGTGGFPITIGSTSIASGSTTTTIAGLTLTSPTINGGALSGTLTGTPTLSGNLTFSGVPNFTGTLTGTQTQCLGLTAGNALAAVSGACGAGGSGTVNSGTATHLAYYATSTTAVSNNAHLTETGSLTGANYNAAALPTALAGTIFQIANADATATRYEADAFGAQATYSAVCYGGTNASPTTVTSGTQCGGYSSFAYDGTATQGPLAAFRTFANQTQAVGSGGFYADVSTTPNGSTTAAEVIRFENDAGITVPATVTGGDQGASTINAGGLFVKGVPVVTATSGVMPFYLGGLAMSNDGTSPNTVIDVAAGVAASDDGTQQMQLAAFTKTLGAFTAGSGNGCLDTGSVASATWYAVEVIKNPSTGGVDVICTVTPSAPTFPSGFTVKRRIGSIFTCDTVVCAAANTNIAQFTQRGSRFWWKNLQAAAAPDIATTTLGTSSALFTMAHVPPGVNIQPICRYTVGNAGNAILITSPDEPDLAPATTTPFGATGTPGFDQLDVTLTSGDENSVCPSLTTNTSQQVRMRATAASTTVDVVVRGYDD